MQSTLRSARAKQKAEALATRERLAVFLRECDRPNADSRVDRDRDAGRLRVRTFCRHNRQVRIRCAGSVRKNRVGLPARTNSHSPRCPVGRNGLRRSSDRRPGRYAELTSTYGVNGLCRMRFRHRNRRHSHVMPALHDSIRSTHGRDEKLCRHARRRSEETPKVAVTQELQL
jgi:hypothetical protein